MLNDEELLDCAISVIDNSYSPYSRFKVAAAVLAADDEAYCGVNVENMSYGLSICAERAAICAAMASGAEQIVTIAVYHDGEDMPYPCGACLQVLSEFNPDMRIIVACYSGIKKYTLKDLLPHSFVADELRK